MTQNGHFSARSVIKSDGHLGGGGGGSTPKNPNPKWESLVVLGFLGFLEKGVESTFLNILDHLRPTCFFREISPGSDNIFNIRNFDFTWSKKSAKTNFKRAKISFKIH